MSTSAGLLDVVLRLRRTGMPVEDVRHFVELVRSGTMLAERVSRRCAVR